jgi:hypothetical protein
MIARHAMALSGVTLALCSAPVRAGPCTQQIYDAQNTVDKRLDAIAAAGKSGNQSVAATMHRQPTLNSVASAEEKLGDISEGDVQALRKDMDDARKADDTGNLAACLKAPDDARRILSR